MSWQLTSDGKKKKLSKQFLYQFALESIARIESYIDGLSFDAFTHEELPRDATILRLQFLGFCLRDLSKKTRTEDTKRYLARKARTYDKLTEDYRKYDYQKIWNAATIDLPKLKNKLQNQNLSGMRKKK